jgi:hypothetical protein
MLVMFLSELLVASFASAAAAQGVSLFEDQALRFWGGVMGWSCAF